MGTPAEDLEAPAPTAPARTAAPEQRFARTIDGSKLARALVLLALTASAVVLGIWLADTTSRVYLWKNVAARGAHLRALAMTLGAGLLAAGGGLVFFFRANERAAAVDELARLAKLLSPLGPLALLPWLFDVSAWQGHDLELLFVALGVSLALGASIAKGLGAVPAVARELERLRERGNRAARAAPALRRDAWLVAVVAGALAYALYFSFHTVRWHWTARSGWDLAIEDNILWNLLHGNAFFKASPIYGPEGSHFARHATLVSYLLLPLYALYQEASTLLVLQAVVLGAAAIPLFLFARTRIGNAYAALVAAVYLMHPALHGANLYEFHYIKLGLLPFWSCLLFLERGRLGAAAIAAVLTLSVREDVATWIAVLGAWAVLFRGRPLFGLGLTVAALAYTAIVKFGIMPRFAGGTDELVHMYRLLIPNGMPNFGGVIATVVTNPGYTVRTLLEPAKLVFSMQLLVPLALLPLRIGQGWFLLLPGFVFCLLSTEYPALIDIGYQYSLHLLAFALPAAVLALERLRASPARMAGAGAAITAGALVLSYQYGAVLQQDTARGGPIPYRFDVTSADRERREALDRLLADIPEDARVSASAFTVPQVSAREDAYSLSLGVWDAEYLLIALDEREIVTPEVPILTKALTSGDFGVRRVEWPFALARRGHPTSRNFEVLERVAPLERRRR